MISAVCWVPKGSQKQKPLRFEVSNEELQALQALEGESEGEDEEEKEGAGISNEDDSGLPPELNMDKYDDDEDISPELLADAGLMNEDGTEVDLGDEEEINEMEHMSLIEDIPTGQIYANDSDDSDAEDYEIKATDSVLLLAKTEIDDDYSSLEIQIYDDDQGNLFTHHDITLPAFPLSIAWMNCPPYPPQQNESGQLVSSTGSYIAVGTFSPAIEIWNLDVLDALEPSAILGGQASKKKKKKKKKKTSFLPGSHKDAVLGLSWNALHRQVLASASADETVKVWDITTQQCSHTFDFPRDKAQAVQWHPLEGTVLATASYDRELCVVDGRSPESRSSFTLSSDPEAISWNPFNPAFLYCATEDGVLSAFDVRVEGKLFSSFTAHEKGISSFSFCKQVPGLVATCSVDKTVKLWDVVDISNPLQVASKSMAVGKLFSVQFYDDIPFLLACGGDEGIAALWYTNELEHVKKTFGPRLAGYDALKATETQKSADQMLESMADMNMDIEESAKIEDPGDTMAKKKKKKKKKSTKK